MRANNLLHAFVTARACKNHLITPNTICAKPSLRIPCDRKSFARTRLRWAVAGSYVNVGRLFQNGVQLPIYKCHHVNLSYRNQVALGQSG